jgi:hypothetical protein
MAGNRALVHVFGSYVASLSESALEELALVHLNAGYTKPLPYTMEALERVASARPEVVVTYVPTRLASKG